MSVARSSIVAYAAAAPDPTRTLVVALAFVLLLLVVPPLIFLLNGSLHTTTVTGALGDFTLAYYRRLLSDRLEAINVRAAVEQSTGERGEHRVTHNHDDFHDLAFILVEHGK